MSDFARYLISIGGMTSTLLAASLWLLARPQSRAARRLLIGLVVFYSGASTPLVANVGAALLIRPYHPLTRADVPAGRTAVVILGSGTFTARDWDEGRYALPDPAGADRVLEAARVARVIDAAYLISSGGSVGSMDPGSPAGQIMADALVELGVPRSRILVETASQTTRDEAVIVRRMLEPLHVDHVVIVTSDIHMRRSLGTFRSEGIDAIPAIARTPHYRPPWGVTFIPSTVGFEEMQSVAHELMGIAYYTLRGWFR